MKEPKSPGQIGLAEPLIVAVDNGGSNTRIEIRQGITFRREAYPTPPDYATAVEKIGATACLLAGGRKFNAAGFSLAGEVDGSRIVKAGQLQAYGWVGKQFKDDVAQALGLEAEAIDLKNDCVAAAKAQQVDNKKVGGVERGYVESISTGVGGAAFQSGKLIPDEPGHEFLKSGATCGCGQEGCVEAHISGSGISRKFGVHPKELPLERWAEVVDDATKAHVQLLNRLKKRGFEPEIIYLFGSMALKVPYLMLPGLSEGLRKNRHKLPYVPDVISATYRDDSPLVGAAEAALELVVG